MHTDDAGARSPGAVVATTQRLELRCFSTADAEAFFALNNDPEAIRYTGDVPFASVAAAREFLARYDQYRLHGFGRWSVYLRNDDQYLGFCGLRRSPGSGEVDLGFRIAPPHWGHGYATEAAGASLRLGFERFGLDSIIARAMPDNRGSHRVLQKLGFVQTGRQTADDGEWILFAIHRGQSSRWSPVD